MMNPPPPKPRKKRSDSIEHRKQLHERLKTEIEPPKDIKLLRRERIVFKEIIEELPMDAWEPFKIRLAASLAKTVVKSEDAFEEICEEGFCYETLKGERKVNPKYSAYQSLTTSIASTARLLGVSASQRGHAKDTDWRRKDAEKEAKAAMAAAKKKSLLA